MGGFVNTQLPYAERKCSDSPNLKWHSHNFHRDLFWLVFLSPWEPGYLWIDKPLCKLVRATVCFFLFFFFGLFENSFHPLLGNPGVSHFVVLYIRNHVAIPRPKSHWRVGTNRRRGPSVRLHGTWSDDRAWRGVTYPPLPPASRVILNATDREWFRLWERWIRWSWACWRKMNGISESPEVVARSELGWWGCQVFT